MVQLRAVITAMAFKMPHSLVAGNSQEILTPNPAKNLFLGIELEVLITVLVFTGVVTDLRISSSSKAHVGGRVR